MAWELLSQVPSACALLVGRKTMRIAQQTQVAKKLLGRELGQHIASALAQANQSSVLRKAVEVVEGRLRGNPDMQGFHTRTLNLTWVTSARACPDLTASLVFVPRSRSSSEDSLIIILNTQALSRNPHASWQPGLDPSSGASYEEASHACDRSTVVPDDSASQIAVDPSEADLKLRARTLDHFNRVQLPA
eukprot:339311-Amphidinium_carterae.1